MQGEKKLIILCATYNHVNSIRKALEGFFMQKTNFDYIVYVHDDASTDGTQDILREYQNKYPDRLLVDYELENQYSKGVHPYHNIFASLDEYKYTALCEGDDYWVYPYKLQKQYDILEKNKELSMCVHNGLDVDNARNIKNVSVNQLKEGLVPPQQFIAHENGSLPTSSFFFRTEFFSKRPQYMKEAPIDDDIILCNCGKNGGIFYFDEVWTVYNYQSGAESWTAKVVRDEKYLRTFTECYIKFLDEYELDTNGKFGVHIRTWRLMILHTTIQNLLRNAGNTVRELYTLIESYKDLFNHKYDFEFEVSFKCSLVHCVDFKEYLCSYKSRNSNKKIFIYGAGEIAQQILFELGHDYSGIEGCVVSSEPLTPKFGGFNVSNINDVINREENPIFVLALGLKNTYQVMEHLNELGVSDSIL